MKKQHKPSVVSKPKTSLGTKAWAYISIAGALVAIIYAGLSMIEEGRLEAASPNDKTEIQQDTSNKIQQNGIVPEFSSPQDPSH
ncbi:MAG: hypothetical protein AAFP02_10280 [Bacteroidota bacterium]